MKVTQNKTSKQSKPFPKLMIGNDTPNPMVVLFFSEDDAIVIDSTDSKNFNNFDKYDDPKKWIHCFDDYEGSITISND